MTLAETLEASEVLRRYTACFESCTKKGKEIEARTYLPNIKKACEILGMDWRAVLGIENERFFTDIEPFLNGSISVQDKELSVQLSAQNPVVAVQSHIIRNCVVCNKSLAGMRKDAKVCSNSCRNKNRK